MAGVGGGAVELGVGYVSVLPKMGAFDKAINSSLSKAGDGVGGKIGAKIDSGISKVLKTGVAATGVAVGGVLATSITKGLGRLNAIEQAKVKFEALGHSAKQQESLMKDVTAAVKGTAFATSDAADAAAMALAGGIKPGKELTGVLKTMGDAASFANKPFSDVAPIFTKAINQGKVMGDTLMQLEENAIPATQSLAKHLGKTATEIKDMASKGEISFTDLQAAMDASIGGQALKAGETFTGSLANIGAAMARFGETLLQPVFSSAPAIFSSLGAVFDSLTEAIEPAMTQIGGILEPALGRVAGLIETRLAPALGVGAEKFGELLVKMAEAAVDPQVWEWVADAFQSMADSARNAGPAFGELVGILARIGATVSVHVWVAFANVLEALVPIIENVLIPLLEKVADVSEKHPKLVQGMVMAWLGFRVLGGITKTVSGIATSFKTLGTNVSKFWKTGKNTASGIKKLGGVAKDAAPFFSKAQGGSITTGIKSFGTLLGEAFPKVGKFAGQLKNLGTSASGAAGGIKGLGPKIAGALSGAGGAAKGGIGSMFAGIGTALGPVIGKIGKALAPVGKIVGGAFSKLAPVFTRIAGAMKPFVGWIVKLAPQLLRFVPIIGGIVTAGTALWAFFTKTETGRKIWASLMDALQTAWQWVKDTFAPVWEWLSGIVSTAWEAIKNAFSTFVNFLKNAWESWIKPVFDGFMFALKILAAVVGTIILGSILVAWNLLSTVISAVWENVIKPVFNAWVDVMTWLWTTVLQPFFNWLGEAFTTVATFLWNLWTTYIKVVWDAFASAVSWLWNTVLMPVFEFIKTAFMVVANTLWNIWVTVIKVVWDAFAAAVGWIWNTIIMPIFELIKFAFQAVGAVFMFVWNNVIKPAWDALGAGIAFVWNNVINPTWEALKAALQVVGNFFQMIWNNVIKPAWDALGTGISWVVDNVVRPAFERIKSALTSVKEFFSTIVDGIRTVWDELKGHVARPINFVIETVWNNGLVKAWNKIGEFLPGLPAASTLAPVAFAKGGKVPLMPGSKKGKDSVNAMLMPGEHVLTTADVKAMGGQQNVYAFRQSLHGNFDPRRFGGESMLPGFKDGGEVSGGVRLAPSPGEGGMKPIAILAKRLIHKIWPEISTIGGYRQDAYPEHPSGRALDVMVPSFDIGDQVNEWTHANNEVLPFIHTIWKQRWRPAGNIDGSAMEDRGSPTQNHMDHVHTWYQDAAVNPNVVPEGLVGYDGLSDADRIEILKAKVQEILDGVFDPIKDAMSAIIGDPPPEWLGIPHPLLDKSKEGAVDSAFGFIDNLGDMLKEAYNLARDIGKTLLSVIPGFAEGGAVTKKTGLFRDNGGMIPTGQSIVRNETGRPEAVLNWKQVDRIRDILASLKNVEELQKLAEVVGRMATTGVYDPRASEFGIDSDDDDLVQSLWKGRDEWLTQGAAFEQVLKGAQDKAIKGYQDEFLDFFGFGELFNLGLEVQDAFNPKAIAENAVSDATATGVAVSTDPGRTPTGTGVSRGQELVYGDPNLTVNVTEVDSKVKMPDLDRAIPPGTGAERWRPMMIDALRNQGMDDWADNPAIVDRFIRQIDTESKGDHMIAQQIHDVNGTGEGAGVGLGQAIPTTWQGYRDPSLPDDRRNPWAMLNFMARYVRQKYGDRGYERIGNGVGYDNGGWLQPGKTLVNNQTGVPEAVFNPSQWSMLRHQTEVVAEMAKDGAHGGPMVYIENQYTSNADEAARAQMREARRASRANSIAGGW